MKNKELIIQLKYLLASGQDPEIVFRKVLRQVRSDQIAELQTKDCTWDLIDPDVHFLENKAKKIADNLDDHLARFQQIQPAINLICNDFGVATPYNAEIKKLQRGKKLKSEEEAKIKNLLKFGEHTQTLSLIKEFLVEIPDTEEFKELAFLRGMLEQSISLPDFFEHPEKIDRQVLSLFEEYRAMYVRLYTEKYKLHRDKVKKFFRNHQEIEKKLNALHALDQIHLLGENQSRNLLLHWQGIINKFNSCAECRSSNAEIRKLVNESAKYFGFSLRELGDDQILHDFQRDLDEALESKLAIIRMKSVQKVLASSRASSVKKLKSMLSLSKLKDIIEVFDKKNTPIIIHELKDILDDADMSMLQFGDFCPSLKALKTDKDLEKIAREFKKFLKTRLASMQNTPTSKSKLISEIIIK